MTYYPGALDLYRQWICSKPLIQSTKKDGMGNLYTDIPCMALRPRNTKRSTSHPNFLHLNLPQLAVSSYLQLSSLSFPGSHPYTSFIQPSRIHFSRAKTLHDHAFSHSTAGAHDFSVPIFWERWRFAQRDLFSFDLDPFRPEEAGSAGCTIVHGIQRVACVCVHQCWSNTMTN